MLMKKSLNTIIYHITMKVIIIVTFVINIKTIIRHIILFICLIKTMISRSYKFDLDNE